MIRWDNNSMNTSDIIQSRNNENQTRMRPHNDTVMHNYYPVNIGMQPFMYSPQVFLNTNGVYPIVNNTSESSSDQSGLLSPNIDSNTPDRPLYHMVQWQDIADKYEGIDKRPKCGRLMNNVYFTQRAASSDKYMIFDTKSDYINNFVNYYFSDKNLALDQKLVALMDDKGIIPLSALIKFPKLHQIDSTIDDLIKAFMNNNIVMSVDLINGEKGAQRRDKWCPGSNSHKVDGDKFTDGGNDSLNSNLTSSDTQQPIMHADTIQLPNQQLFYSLISPIYTQQPGMMANTANIGPMPSYWTNTSFQSHPAQNQSASFWPIQLADYGNPNMLQQMPLNRFNAPNSEMSGNRLN